MTSQESNTEQSKKRTGLLGRLELEKEIELLKAEKVQLEAEKARLKQRVSRLNTLHEIGRIFAAISDPSEVLTKIVEAAVFLTEADEGSLMLVDNKNELYIRAQKGLKETTAAKLKLKVSDSLAGSVVRTGEPLRFEKRTKVVTGYMVNALIYVPLKYVDKILGVLSVDNQEKETSFNQEDQHILSILADYAAIALENTSLFDGLRKRNQLLTSLHKSGRSILWLSAASLGEFLTQVAQSTLELLRADTVIVYEYDHRTNKIILPPSKHGFFYDSERISDENLATVHRKSVIFNLVRQAKPFYATNAKQDWINAGLFEPTQNSLSETFISREKIVSSAGIPLTAGSVTVGIMFINFRRKHEFVEEEKEIIDLLANQAAIAIQNSGLIQDKERRIKELAGLLDTSPVITDSPLELHDVLKRIVDNARKVINCNYALVFTYDSKKERFEQDVIMTSGVSNQLAQTICIPRSNGMSTRVLNEGMVLVNDVKDATAYPFIDRNPRTFISQAQVQAIIGVRLQAGHEQVGILYADFCDPQNFNENQLQILQLFANQAAIAVNNARLFHSTQRHVTELSVLNHIGQTISSYSFVLEVENFLPLIYEQTGRLMDVTNFFIAFYDKENDLVRFKFATEFGKPVELGTNEWTDRKGGNGLTEYVIRSEKSLLISRGYKEWFEEQGIDLIGNLPKSWLGSLLIARGRILGVIGVQSYEIEQAYDEGHQDVLETIALQAAIAIENVQLLQERKLRLEELTALYETSMDITRNLELEPLLNAIVQRAAGLLKSPSGGVVRRVTNSGNLVMQYTYNLDLIRGWEYDLGQGLIGRIAQTGQPLIENNYHSWKGKDRRFEKEPYEGMLKAVVGVPLKQQDENIGVLVVSDTATERVYTNNDIRLLELFANLAVIAIQNAELFNEKVIELDKRLRELEALREADLALLSSRELGDVLKTILEKIADFVECDCIVIRLWDEENAQLVLKAEQGKYPGKIPLNLGMGLGVSGRAASESQPMVSADVRRNADHIRLVSKTKDPDERKYLRWVRSEVAVPLIAKSELVGLLTVQSLKKDGFYRNDIQLMDRFAGQAAIALHNARLVEQSRRHTVLVAHQLKGPLQAIRGDVDYQMRRVKRQYADDKQLEYFNRRIQEHFSRVKQELDMFSFLVRSDLGIAHKFSMNLYSLAQIIDEAVAQFKEVARYRGIIININPAIRELPRIYVDRENMLTVFTNLIENAVKYSFDNKTIDIEGQRYGNKVIIYVSDFGLGVLPEDQERLFELYKRGRLKDKKRFIEGTGIGLWVVKEIIRAHGGKISVWSGLFDHPKLLSSDEDVVNRGFKTQFTIELPT
ncbi:MAG: GAF domain-containing protein [Anaerolineae bacterium]|nr:GAF domain-containing protein [Anaerolineae bacterium]